MLGEVPSTAKAESLTVAALERVILAIQSSPDHKWVAPQCGAMPGLLAGLSLSTPSTPAAELADLSAWLTKHKSQSASEGGSVFPQFDPSQWLAPRQ